MAETTTKTTRIKVKDFIAGVENDTRRKDAETLLRLFERATGWKAQMWGQRSWGTAATNTRTKPATPGEQLSFVIRKSI